MYYQKKAESPKYTTADVKAFYDLSTKGLFYYEEKGIITPYRQKDNQYRLYGAEECARLYQCKFYRSIDFSLEDSANMVNQVGADDLSHVLNMQCEKLEKEAAKKLALASRTRRTAGLVDTIRTGIFPFEECVSPAMLRVSNQRHDAKTHTVCMNREDYRNWCCNLPFTSASIIVSHETLFSDAPYQFNLGFIIEEKEADALALNESPHAILLPKRRCIYTIVAGEETDFYTPKRFLNAVERIKKEGYQVNAPVYTRMIGTLDNGNGMLRYDEAWFPIETD